MSSALRWLLPRCHDTKYLYHTPNYWGGKKAKWSSQLLAIVFVQLLARSREMTERWPQLIQVDPKVFYLELNLSSTNHSSWEWHRRYSTQSLREASYPNPSWNISGIYSITWTQFNLKQWIMVQNPKCKVSTGSKRIQTNFQHTIAFHIYE